MIPPTPIWIVKRIATWAICQQWLDRPRWWLRTTPWLDVPRYWLACFVHQCTAANWSWLTGWFPVECEDCDWNGPARWTAMRRDPAHLHLWFECPRCGSMDVIESRD